MKPANSPENKNAVEAVASAPTAVTKLDSIHIVPAPAECVNPSNFLARALPLAELGLEVFPIDARGKEPVALGFLNAQGKPARLSPLNQATKAAAVITAKWGGEDHAECNVGVLFRGANYGVDIDSLSACEKILGRPLDIQGVRVNTSTPDKLHLYFDGAPPEWCWVRSVKHIREGKERELLSIRRGGRYLVGPGSIHPEGATYQWADGVPHVFPATNENLLRQLQEIAEKQEEAKPQIVPMEKALSAEQFEKVLEKMRENFERMGFPAFEERISRAHGGVEFIFDECPLEYHAEGNNTGMIAVRPDGVLCWGCFHSHGSLKWSEAKPLLEAKFGSKFDFGDVFKGPTPTVGIGGSIVPYVTKATKPEGPILIISAAQLNETVLKAESLLATKHDLNYFRRGSDLVKPVQRLKKDVPGLGRDKEAVVVCQQ